MSNAINNLNLTSKDSTISQDISAVIDLSALRQKNKIKNIVKNAFSFGLRHFYWNHKLAVSLLNNHCEGVKQALECGASRNLSLKTWNKLTQDETTINQESMKFFMRFSVIKNENPLINRKWSSLLFRDKMTHQNMNTISKVLNVYSHQYTKIFDKPNLEVDKFTKVFLNFTNPLKLSNNSDDTHCIKQTIFNIIDTNQKMQNESSYYLNFNNQINIELINNAIKLLNHTNCNLAFISKIEKFHKEIKFDNFFAAGIKKNDNQTNSTLDFLLNNSLIQAKKKLFQQAIKEKNIYLINALILTNTPYKNVKVDPMPENELLKLLENTLEYPNAFCATINQIKQLDEITIKNIFFLVNKCTSEIDRNLFIKKILEKIPSNYSFDDLAQQLIFQFIISNDFTKNQNPINRNLISEINFNHFSDFNKINPLLKLSLNCDISENLIVKNIIDSGLDIRGYVLVLYSAHLHRNKQMIDLINKSNFNFINLQPDDILYVLDPTIDLSLIEFKEDFEIKQEIKDKFIAFLKKNNFPNDKIVGLKNTSPTELFNKINSSEKLKELLVF